MPGVMVSTCGMRGTLAVTDGGRPITNGARSVTDGARSVMAGLDPAIPIGTVGTIALVAANCTIRAGGGGRVEPGHDGGSAVRASARGTAPLTTRDGAVR